MRSVAENLRRFWGGKTKNQETRNGGGQPRVGERSGQSIRKDGQKKNLQAASSRGGTEGVKIRARKLSRGG